MITGIVIHPQAFPDVRAARLASALLSRHSAGEIADAIEVLIDVLDALGGDPDGEDDDPAGQCDEDGVNTALHLLAGHGPGCMIADEDFDDGQRLALG